MDVHRKLILSIFLASLIPQGETANILVTVVGIANSQILVMNRLAEIMGERGHNVTILNFKFFPEAKPIDLKYSKEISYNVVDDPEILDKIRSTLASQGWEQSEGAPVPIDNVRRIFGQLHQSCEKLLDNKPFLQSLNHSKFDVVVIHVFDYCTFGLTHLLNIEAYVWMSTAFLLEPMAWYSGSPLAQSYVPNMPPPSNPSGYMSFLDRIKNFFVSTMLLGVFQYGIVTPYTELFRKHYGHDFPHYDDILKKTQLYFTLADPLFEYARPTSENVIDVGGLTMKKPEPLKEKWKQIVDEAPKEGIVIFSLGSVANTSTMPQHLRMAFLNAFKRFPHLFIWRFEGDFPEAKTAKNVFLSKWIPQKDLLAHPKMKAAIIHGGYNSLTEVTYTGVPVVVLPLFGDQYGNAIRITRQNLGVRLDRHNLNEESVFEALNKVLYDEKIQASAHRLGQMIRERPFSAYQQATEWLEYLAKFKRLDQLQPQSHQLYLFQYLLLDILALLLTIFLTVFAVFKFCCCFFVRKCTGKHKSEGKSKKE